jgi:N12 class adenine-specific DNA methylase
MASIQELRAQDPDLEGLDDEQVVDVYHQTYYPDMAREDVASALGVKPAPPPESTEGRGMLGWAKDSALSLGKGVVGVPEAVVGLADMATGGRVGKALEEGVEVPGTDGFRLRYDPETAKEVLSEQHTDQQKTANKAVMEAEGLWETVKQAVKNPSVAGMSVLESIPLMFGGGLVGRGVAALGRGQIGAGMAAAVGEGVSMAGGAAEQIRQQTEDGLLTGEQAGIAGATGAAGAAFGLLGVRIAHSLGLKDIDEMIVGAAVNAKAQKHIARKVLEGAVAEGLLEELPQSVSEQVLQNMALGRPLDEGVNQAAVLGTMAGKIMGGGAQLLGDSKPTKKKTDVPPPAGAPAPAPAPAPTPTDVLNAPSVDAAIDMALQAAGVAPPAAAAAPSAPSADELFPKPPVSPASMIGGAPTAAAPVAAEDDDPFTRPIPGLTPGATSETNLPSAGSAGAAAPAAAQPAAPIEPGPGQQLPGVVPDGGAAGSPAAGAAQLPAGSAGSARPVAGQPAPADATGLVEASAATPEKLALQLARATAAVGEAQARLDKNPSDANRLFLADSKDVESAVRTQIADARAADAASWERYEAEQKAVAALAEGARVQTPDGPGTILKKFPRNWQVQVDGAGRRLLPPGALKPLAGSTPAPSVEPPPNAQASSTPTPAVAPAPTDGGAAQASAPAADPAAAAGQPGRAGSGAGDAPAADVAEVPKRKRGESTQKYVERLRRLRARADVAQAAALDNAITLAAVDTGEEAEPIERAAGIEPGKAAPLYAQRKVTNADDILAWAKSEGITGLESADKLHVTIAFSREAVDPGKVGNTSPAYDAGYISGTSGRRAEYLGDQGALVLKFDSPVLTARWQQFRKAGASWDFEGYQPHITLAYHDSRIDLSKVKPYTGKIELGPELQEPLDITPKETDTTTATAPSAQAPSADAGKADNPGPAREPAEAAPKPTPQVTDPGTKYVLPSFVTAGQRDTRLAHEKRKDGDELNDMLIDEGMRRTSKNAWTISVGERGTVLVERSESRFTIMRRLDGKQVDSAQQYTVKTVQREVREQIRAGIEAEREVAPAPAASDDRVTIVAGNRDGAWLARDTTGTNLAEFGLSSTTGKVVRINHFFAASETRVLAERAIRRWADERRKVPDVGAAPTAAPAPTVAPAPVAEPEYPVGIDGKPEKKMGGAGYAFPSNQLVANVQGAFAPMEVGATAIGETDEGYVNFGKNWPDGRYYIESKGEAIGFADGKWGPTNSRGVEPKGTYDPSKLESEIIRVLTEAGAKRKAAPKKPEPSANKVFTDDMAAAARARLKAKLGRLGSGIDPEMLADGIVLAGYHVEKGARKFAAFAQAMLQDMGEEIRPYVKQLYMALKYDPRAGDFTSDMSSASFVDEFDIGAIAAPSDSNVAQPADTGEQDGTATRGLDSAGTGAPEGAPAADVRAPAGGRDAGAAPDADRGGRGRGDAPADRAGSDVAGGVGAGARDAVPPAGGRAGSRDAGNRGVQGAPGADAGAEPAADAGREGGRGVAPNAAPTPANQYAPAAEDFTIEDDFALGEGGQKTKYRNNVAAVRLLRELDASGRTASVEDQRVLAKYVGWGGLPQAFDAKNADWAKEHAELRELLSDAEYDAARRSTRYAHYTSREIVQDGIYAALRRFGFNGGRVLEGGAGVGNFIGLMPKEMRTNGRVTAIERELIAGSIAKHLYPLQNVQLADFTEFKGNDGYFDAAVGNPPFASDPQTDKSGRKHLSGLSLHNYFFAKEVDMLREGGILAQVVTNSFLDAAGDRARKYIADRTKFLGAIRLPNNAFSKNANTEVTTDIIFLQKRPESEWGSKAAKEEAKQWLDVRPYQGKSGEPVNLNVYFHAHPDMMLGDFGGYGTMYGPNQPALVAQPGQDTLAMLQAAVQKLPEAVYKSIAETGTDAAIDAEVKALTNPPVQEGGFFLQDGKVMQRLQDLAGEARGVEITPQTQWTEKTKLGEKDFERIKLLAGLRSTLRALLAAELKSDPAMEGLRKTLNEQYDAYRKDFGLLGDRGTYRVFDDDPDFPLLLSLEHNYTPGIGPAEAKKLGIKATKSTAKKSPIFERRVVEARERVRKVESPADALAVSMAERGRLDTAYIGELLGKDPEDVLREMTDGEQPLLFLDPATDEYVLRDAYLSGNVRQKLQQARAAAMPVNVRELERVQPEDVPAHEISARIGAPWVPTGVYEDFAKELFGEGTAASITYQKLNSSYGVYIKPGSEVNNSNKWGIPKYSGTELLAALLNNRTIKVQYRDADKNLVTDVEATEMANTKAQEIKDRFGDWLMSDPDRSALLTRAYNDANNNYVTRQFDGSWMTFPGKVPDMKKPGDGGITFRRHQRNAIARIVQDRTALLDHVVGAGKTFTVVAAAMELKRTGLARKPLVAVPNHLVKQWAADFYRLYPGANILTATKKDFERVNRRRFLAKIATGDWDAVVIAHSSFGFIQPGAAFEADFNQRQIELIMSAIKDVDESDGDDKAKERTVKQLEGMKERLENRIERLRDKPMDDLLDFEELGVDQLFVDEAHLFKNLMYQTKLQNVAGLGDPAGAKRAYDMYVKTQQIMEQNGRGQGVVFATGTPVSNSLAEKYHMMRYLMPRQMDELGFQSFDAWANTYADVRQHWMQKVSGDGFKAQNRMSEFVNVHELLKLFDQVADTVTNDDIKKAYREENDGAEYPLPPVKGGKPRAPVSLDKSPAQTAYMEELAKRAAIVEARKGPPKKGEDNHLSLMTDARKAAMDIRLVDLDATEREKGGRIDRAADEIVARFEQWNHVKGTQLVFSDLGTPKKHAEKELKEYQRLQAIVAEATDDVRNSAAFGNERAQEIVDAAEDAEKEMDEKGQDWLDSVKAALRGFSVYDDLKEALVERGIPEAQIAFIHDYNTDDQKAALFRKVKNGDIRVLMGSTPKMGAGTNVQDRLVALHHLDVPWKPSDVEQREGRIVRQGNVLLEQIPGFEVEILAYVTKDTLDMRMWQIQEVKLKIINQLRTRQIERNIDNAFEDMEMSASEMQAAATGNMDLLYEIQARNDIKQLEQKRRSFEAQKNDLIGRKRAVAKRLKELPPTIERERTLKKYGEAYQTELNESASAFKVTIDGKEYTDWREAGAYLQQLTDAKIYTRTVQKDGKKVREELSAEEYEKLAAKKAELEKAGKTNDDAEYRELVFEVTSWEGRAAPLDVEMNGEQFTARAKLAEAFSTLRGDRDPLLWKIGGNRYNRRVAVANEVRQLVTDALADEKEATLGELGPFTVHVEGQPKDKFGNRALDIWIEAGGLKIDGYITVQGAEDDEGKSAQPNMQDIAERAVDWAARQAHNAGGSVFYLERDLEAAKRQQKDLDSADELGEWPDQGKLEEARKKHQEVLARLKTKGAGKPDAPAFYQETANAPAAVRRKVGELQQKVDAITEGWAQTLPVTVVSSIDSPSVPARIREANAENKARGGGSGVGVIFRGEVWIFADKVTSDRELATVLYHEVLGHAGLRGHFGPELDKVLNQVALLRRDDVRRMIERNGMTGPRVEQRAAEEVLAYLAQTQPQLSLVQRAIAAIRTFLREHVPGFKNLELSDAELIRNFILPARQFIEGGPGPRGGQRDEAAFSAQSRPFYSALSRAMEAVPAKALPVAGWTGAIQAQINKGAVKADEVEWSGIREWLQLQGDGKVAKAAVLDYLQANGVRVEEVVKGGADAADDLDRLIVEADALGWTFDRDGFNEGDGDYFKRAVVFERRSDGKQFEFTGDKFVGEDGEVVSWEQPIARIAQQIDSMAYEETEGLEQDGTRYSQYTLPGGENYREMLLTLPTRQDAIEAHRSFLAKMKQQYPGTIAERTAAMTEAERSELERLGAQANAQRDAPAYRSNHWSEDNIVAHIRMNERTDAEGKRVLFIEELQSDWAQQGRRNGFKGDTTGLKAEREYANPVVGDVWSVTDANGRSLGSVPTSRAATADDAIREIAASSSAMHNRAPRAPFVDKTDAWLSLALKRIVKYAVDNGFDRVAFVNGRQSADRYSLAKVVDYIDWFVNTSGTRNVTLSMQSGGQMELIVDGDGVVRGGGNRVGADGGFNGRSLGEVIGKELAVKVMSAESGSLSTKDLQVGGEGMIAFYDKIVPAALGKLLPKVGGGKVTTVKGIGAHRESISAGERFTYSTLSTLGTNEEYVVNRETDEKVAGPFATWEEAHQWLIANDPATRQALDQPGFDVTDAMRAAAAEGLPMFAQGFNTRHIQVDGQWRPIDAANGQPIHPTFQGQAEFWRRFADRFPLDGMGRPQVDQAEVARLLDSSGFDPMFSQEAGLNNPRDFRRLAREAVSEMHEGTPGKLHWWHKTIGTQYNLAQKSPAFKRVFGRVQDFLEDVSYYATEAANKAPSILPQLETWRDVMPKWAGGSGKKPLSAADNAAIRAPIFEGTLEWTRDKFGNAIRIDDMRAAAKTMTADEKGAQMVRNNQLSPSVLKMWQGLPHEQYAAMVESRFENTALKAGIVWTRTELARYFSLDEAQQGLYFEFRKSVDQSILQAALADMVRFVGEDAEFISEQVMQAASVKEGMDLLAEQLKQRATDDPERAASMAKTIDKLDEKARRAQELMDKGYAPLMRFGHYTVTVYGTDEETGEEEVKYFGMYENAVAARIAAKNLEAEMDDVKGLRIERGTMNEESYKLFAGISPETVELFGEMLGMSETGTSATDLAFQAYLKLARNNRSAMKRLIHRKGTAGFSEDVGRVLASFTYSTARLTSRNLHAGQIAEAVRDIPKGQGELARQATRLQEYVNNPGEEAQALRGLLFAQYLGGSIAAALVNATQPFQVTMPYLSQFGGIKASAGRMGWALRHAWAASTGDAALDRDLKRAVEDGIVAPQEVHQLMAQGQGKGGLISGDGTTMGNTYAAGWNFAQRLMAAWGKPFSTAELFNRRVTFVAAYRTAQQEGIANPFEFAKQAVIETQFLYNKGNRPEWARGALGATLMTFKQYSISYLELVGRMWNAGEPGSPERAAGRRAVFFAAGMVLLVGGGGGLPFVEDVEDVVDGLMQRLGYNWQTKQKKRELLQQAFGKAFGSFLEKGISGLPGAPIDVSGRLGMGNLLPGTGIFQKKQDHARDVLEVAGPTGDLFSRAGKAAGAVASGELGEAGRQIVPKAMRDIIKAVEMNASGQYKDERGYKVIDVTPGDVAAKAIGFQPGAVAKASEADRSAQQMVNLARMREGEIAAKWAKGIAERDQALQQEARRELADWNDKNPSTPIRIRLQDVLRRSRKMMQSRAQRIEGTAPKEVRQEARRLMDSER